VRTKVDISFFLLKDEVLLTVGCTIFPSYVSIHSHSAHVALLEKPSSGTLKVKRLELKLFGRKKTKGPKQDSQNQLRLPMTEGEAQ
jgi:hypothetical protein